jgi:DNA-binding MarR family transcriptional regulator
MTHPNVDLEALERRVFRLTEALRRRFARHLAQYGLTPPQFITLCSLAQSAEKSSRMGPLAAAAFQSAASMTGIVDRLLERGLVRREQDPQDRRSVVVVLTEEGERLLREIREERRRDMVHLLRRLPAEDQAQLSGILERLLEGLEEENPPQGKRE